MNGVSRQTGWPCRRTAPPLARTPLRRRSASPQAVPSVRPTRRAASRTMAGSVHQPSTSLVEVRASRARHITAPPTRYSSARTPRRPSSSSNCCNASTICSRVRADTATHCTRMFRKQRHNSLEAAKQSHRPVLRQKGDREADDETHENPDGRGRGECTTGERGDSLRVSCAPDEASVMLFAKRHPGFRRA